MILNNKDFNKKNDIKELLDAIYLLAKNDTNNIESKLSMYQFCASSFWHNYSGTFVHHQLEEDLMQISNEIIDCELDINFENNHILHIMTEAYNTGGHTRVVENWIKSTPHHIHSVFLNNHFSAKPSFLVEAVVSNKGSIIVNDKNSFVEKANFLAQIASRFKYIILHHHPHDILPLLSFGTKKFLRPVFFYNHADHVWGCGYSISDFIIEISKQGVQHSIKYRGIPENKVIFAGIPVSLPEKSIWIECPENKYIISMASAYKFSPIENLSFQDFIDRILTSEPTMEYYVIGVSPSDEYWQTLKFKYPTRVHFKGILQKKDAHALIQKATLYLDSFPLGSGTSLIEAMSLGIPVLSYASPIQQMDSYKNFSYDNINILFEKCLELINLSVEKRTRIVKEQQNQIDKWHSLETFKFRVSFLDKEITRDPIKLENNIVEDNYKDIYNDFLFQLLLQDNFRFDNGIINILDSLKYEQLKKITHLLFKSNLSLYDNIEWLDYIKNRRNLYIQLYISNNYIFNEFKSIKFSVLENNEIQKFEFDLRNHKNITSLRLDPLNDCCVVEIEKIYLVLENTDEVDLLSYMSLNNIIYYENNYFFDDSDPQIYFIDLDIELLDSAKKLCIELKYNHISKDALHECIKQITIDKNNNISILENENLRLQGILFSLENELVGVYNSKSWKITRPLRSIIRKIKN